MADIVDPPHPFGNNPPVNADVPVEPEPEDEDDETGESAGASGQTAG